MKFAALLLVSLLGSTAFAADEATTLYDRTTDINTLDAPSLARFQEIAKTQAGIWGDTILEGEYFSDGATVVDRVVALSRGKEVVSYRVTYSERAWDTSECSFNGHDLETLEGCKPGRIHESSFVTTGLTSYTRDMNDLAQFE